MKRFRVFLLGIGLALCFGTNNVGATGLKIAPLSYDNVVLKKGEVQKGFVDVSNPGSLPVQVDFSARAFRQIDDDGSLQFFVSEQVSAGVRLDYDSISLGPRQAVRMYFLLDGNKLPSGNVFAAIFATTAPSQQGGSEQAVQVGTILAIQNGTPASARADITSLTANLFQIGDGLSAKIKVHNPADEKATTGFFPIINVGHSPYGATKFRGSLVFAGRTRTVDYKQKGDYFGPIWLNVNAGGSSKSQLILAATGYWRWLAPLILLLIIGFIICCRKFKVSTAVRRYLKSLPLKRE